MQEIRKMDKNVTIQLLDVLTATYPKTLEQSEPVVLRRDDAIKQVGDISKPLMRLAVSPSKTNLTSDGELKNHVQQLATVEEAQGIFDKAQAAQTTADTAVSLAEGGIVKQVKYGIRVVLSANGLRSFYDLSTNPPAVGDLALAVYSEWNFPLEYFGDNGDRCGVNGLGFVNNPAYAGYSDSMPLYIYTGPTTGWYPCVFDTTTTAKKYKVKVQYDYAYIFNEIYLALPMDTLYPSDVNLIPAFIRPHLQQEYIVEYLPVIGNPSGANRMCRIHQEGRNGYVGQARVLSSVYANIDCGWTAL